MRLLGARNAIFRSKKCDFLFPITRMAIFLFFSLLVFSCTDLDKGLFWSVEHEVEAPDNSLPNNIGVNRIIRVPANPADDGLALAIGWKEARYYIAAGSVFYRYVTPGSNWQQIRTPRSGTTNMVQDIAYLETGDPGDPFAIYAAVSVDARGRMYRLNPAKTSQRIKPDSMPLEWETDPESGYTSFLESPDYDGLQITRFISIDTNNDKTPDEFFTSTTSTVATPGKEFSRCTYSSGLSKTPITLPHYPEINAGTFDGSNYWFIDHTHVFKIDKNSIISSIPNFDPQGSVMWTISGGTATGTNPTKIADSGVGRFNDIFFDSGIKKVFGSGITPPVNRNSDALWTIPNPDIFIASGTGIFSSNTTDSDPVSGNPYVEVRWDGLAGGWYNCLAKIEKSGAEPYYDAVLVCGTEQAGLREIRLNEAKDDYAFHAPPGDYDEYPGLYYASIRCLYTENTPSLNVLIAGTSRSGAWNGDYADITRPIWSIE